MLLNGLFLTLGSGSAWNENLRPLLNTNIPLISEKYGLRNHFWPLESGVLISKSEEKGPNFLGRHGPILKFTYSESSHQIRQLGLNKIFGSFFRFYMFSGPMWALMMRRKIVPGQHEASQNTGAEQFVFCHQICALWKILWILDHFNWF